MPTSYIDLCNMTLRRLNEVEVDQSDFSSVRGVQALVKDAVKNSIARINQSEFSWPFNYSSYTQVLSYFAKPFTLRYPPYKETS